MINRQFFFKKNLKILKKKSYFESKLSFMFWLMCSVSIRMTKLGILDWGFDILSKHFFFFLRKYGTTIRMREIKFFSFLWFFFKMMIGFDINKSKIYLLLIKSLSHNDKYYLDRQKLTRRNKTKLRSPSHSKT